MAIERGTQEAQGETKLILGADDYYFTPAVLRGELGQRLRLEVENESGVLHNMSIPEQQIDTNIPPTERSWSRSPSRSGGGCDSRTSSTRCSAWMAGWPSETARVSFSRVVQRLRPTRAQGTELRRGGEERVKSCDRGFEANCLAS